MTIFKKLGDDSPYMASMGRGKWSILAWPMNTEPCADPDRRRFYFNMREETKPEWQAVLDLDDYEVVPYSPMLTEGLTICLEQNGVAEPLAKSSLRAAGLLSHTDLVLAALKYNLDVVNKTRAQLLALLAQHVAPGDSDFKALVAKDVAPSDVLALLPSDPLFEVTWDEMDTDDKQELGDVKKAVERHKAKATYHLKRKAKEEAFKANKRASLAAAAKAKAGGPPPEAKAPPPIADGPPPAAKAPPPKAGGPPPAKAGGQPVAPPPAVPKAKAGPPHMRGDYQYVEFAGGFLVFSVALKKVNAHCEVDSHKIDFMMQTCTCHMDRSIPLDPILNGRTVKGRPLGLLALWLKRGHEPEHGTKDSHQASKKVLCGAAFQEDRKAARAELWALRGNAPDIQQLFDLEVGDDPLMEPLEVF